MKVIAKESIVVTLDRMIDNLTEEGSDILRVEVTREEFVQIYKKVVDSPLLTKKSVVLSGDDYRGDCVIQSGSYLVYRGVCVQYHHIYQRCKPEVVYI